MLLWLYPLVQWFICIVDNWYTLNLIRFIFLLSVSSGGPSQELKGALASPNFWKKLMNFFFFWIILNNLKIFKRTLSFWPPYPIIHTHTHTHTHTYIYIYLRKSKNKHNSHLNRRIMLKIQTILQKNITNGWYDK